jgi:hypothetical protein
MLMSTAAVSSTSLYQELQQYFQTRQSDLQQLGQNLNAGNLSAAQTDFQDITTLGQTGPFANGNPFGAAQREQDFTAIGQALQSGNASAAQQAFANLEATFQKSAVQNPLTTAPTPAQSAPASGGNGSEIVLNLANSGGGSGPITIDITGQSGGGEQVQINYGAQGSGAQPVTLNVASNEELVLNLLGPATTSAGSTSTSAPASGSLNVSA